MFSPKTACAEIGNGSLLVLCVGLNFLFGQGIFLQKAKESCEADRCTTITKKRFALVFGKQVHEGSPRCVVDNSIRFTGRQIEESRC